VGGHRCRPLDAPPCPQQAAPSKAAANGGGGGSKEAPQGQSLRETYVYRVPGSLRPIFGEAAVQDRDRLYEEREVEGALSQYAAREGAAGPVGLCRATPAVGAVWEIRPASQEQRPRSRERLPPLSLVPSAGLEVPGGGIRLDHLLHGSLYNKKEAAQGAVAPAPELLRRLLGKLQRQLRQTWTFSKVTRTTEQASRAGTSKGPVCACPLAHTSIADM
jgi:hypothetical protein